MVITLSGIYEAGDQIRFTVKGDSPDRTLVQTYVVTAENLTANNDGLSAVVAGNSVCFRSFVLCWVFDCLV